MQMADGGVPNEVVSDGSDLWLNERQKCSSIIGRYHTEDTWTNTVHAGKMVRVRRTDGARMRTTSHHPVALDGSLVPLKFRNLVGTLCSNQGNQYENRPFCDINCILFCPPEKQSNYRRRRNHVSRRHDSGRVVRIV
jgi:hypothetical protein